MDKSSHGRKDRLIKETRHDVYRERGKRPEPTRCPQCGALFVKGRWTWKKAPLKTNQAVCPACRRSARRDPAARIEIKGKFFEEHRSEIVGLIHNIEKLEKGERPLERIMTVAQDGGHTLVTTTGVHLARRIGEALSRSYKGDLSLRYAVGEKNLRVYWER